MWAQPTVLFATERFVLGEFHCPPGDPRWSDVNSIGGLSHVVFPGTSVFIEQAGHRSVLANPNHVVFYRRNQPYRRLLHDPRGDHCVFIAINAKLVAELLAGVGVASSADDLPFAQGPSDAGTYLSVQLVARALRRGSVDRLIVEEAVHHALRQSLERGAEIHLRRRRRVRRRTDREHELLVEAAKRLLTERATANDDLAALSRELHVSEFHLCRVFHSQTGSTLSRYRTSLRLRMALDRLPAGEALAAIARDTGFASHSHLTDAFRAAFGIPPSDARDVLRRRGRGDLRDVLRRIRMSDRAHDLVYS